MGVKPIPASDRCKKCGSRYLTEFGTEICLHIPGQQNLAVPPVLVFPKLAICLDCGTVAEFSILKEHLTELRGHVRRP